MDKLKEVESAPTAPLHRNPRFLALWSALSLTALGSAAAPIALASIALQATGSPALVGLALAARVVPVLLFTLLGGAWGDRYSKSTILSVCDAVNFVAQATFGLGLLLGAKDTNLIALIVATQLTGGMASAMFSPSMRGMIPELVDKDRRVQANSLISASNASAMVAGPILGGMLTLFLAPHAVILGNAALFGVSSLLLLSIRAKRREPSTESKPSILAEIAAAFQVVKTTPWLKWGIVLDSGFGPLFSAPILVLGPSLFGVGTGGEGLWGVLLAAWAVGLLSGSWLAAKYSPINPLRAGSYMLMALPLALAALALGTNAVLSITMIAVSGLASAFYDIHWSTAIQDHVDPDMRSRVFAFNWLGVSLLTPIGYALSGTLSANTGIQPLLLGAGCALAALVGWRLFHPALSIPVSVGGGPSHVRD
ncbi:MULTISPECIES: MFS transporter [unclassified Paenarthrobacter]|uniref:MFS transporter n=1 Tax=unclassified Paenarthrobacter TaxID=2634190 RepID=UPI003F978B32